MRHDMKKPAQRCGGAGRLLNAISLAAINPENARKRAESQGIPAKIAPRAPVAALVLDVGTHEGRDTCRRQLFKLEYRHDDGALIVWTGYSHADALAASRKWTRSGARLVDLTEGAQ